MIIIDKALERLETADTPIRVGMIGAGFMARGVANQIINSAKGIALVAIANRTLERARLAYKYAGVEDCIIVDSSAALEYAIARRTPAITDNPFLLLEAGNIDCIVDVTGAIEAAAHWMLSAIDNGKHVVSMNAELDGTIGALLKRYADRAGVMLTGCDGDQPAVQMNLYRYAKGLGFTPLVCGNIKGLQDPFRTPTTQKSFAERWGQNPIMVTSFADGTKISFEQALVANATGMRVAKRGMDGFYHDGHIDELTGKYDVDLLRENGGVVDYVVGSRPAPGVFVFAAHDDPKQKHYLDLYKLGKGPLYSFYQPYHLCHFDVPISIARAILFQDYAITPIDQPVVEVVATAKRDLAAGERLDCIGGYTMYGEAENSDMVRDENLLPIGLAEGCILKRDVKIGATLTFDDLIIPEGRLIDRLYAKQREMSESSFENQSSSHR
jgi:predicted homoserine dehydrogenase-like protein